MKKSIIAVLAIAALVGCASNPPRPNVIPLAGGTYQAIGFGPTEDYALNASLRSAAKTCKDSKKRHIVTNLHTAYKGLVSEDTNRTLNKAVEVAEAFTMKSVPTLSSKDDYRVTLSFSCEAA
jgi:hypothetical protein